MINSINYRGFIGTVEYCDEDKIFFGRVEGLPKTLISYHGEDLESLKKDFIEAVDFHLLPCEEEGTYTTPRFEHDLVAV